ncbi:MAG TPA: hypothetical protein VEV61_18785 [Streptosporangiaceae bacterium]|nr:hypothetical protein [Streptosporangiaceae bacterium]
MHARAWKVAALADMTNPDRVGRRITSGPPVTGIAGRVVEALGS